MTLTPEQLEAERAHRITERLGILLGDKPVTPSANFIAQSEADEAVKVIQQYGDDQKA